ncbi:MAG TPA: nuclear transport factor 2 family protein, partial [Blastocatellia bacterium]|nr:nuclear transport factor 2 family protein [Blastocatellia bacterium]
LGFAQGAENKNAAAATAKPKMSKKAIERALVAREKALWELVKKNDPKGFKRNFGTDYVGIYEDGVHTLDVEAEGIGQTKLKSYALSDIKMMMPTGDTAILTYKVNSQGEAQGQEFSGDYYCSSTWANRGGRWVAIAHSEVKAKTP